MNLSQQAKSVFNTANNNILSQKPLNTENSTTSMLQNARDIANHNNALSSVNAKKQMDFQTESNAKAMAFSSAEAEKNRAYQERLSNSAHQREVADLLKAGLNPVLSSKYSGSTTPSGSSASGVSSQGSKADVDTSVNNIIGSLLNAVIGQATALQTTAMNNQTALQSTSMMNETQIKNAITAMQATLGSASINANSNQKIQSQAQAFEEYMKKNYPQNMVGGVSSIWSSMWDAFNGASGNSNNNAKSNSEFKKIIDHMIQSFKNTDYGIFNKN